MCAAAGMQVQRLKRIAEGSIQLGKLPLGKWRYLSSDEIASLNTQQ
jgi:23S rRNA pseudouridine2605 synthase